MALKFTHPRNFPLLRRIEKHCQKRIDDAWQSFAPSLGVNKLRRDEITYWTSYLAYTILDVPIGTGEGTLHVGLMFSFPETNVIEVLVRDKYGHHLDISVPLKTVEPEAVLRVRKHMTVHGTPVTLMKSYTLDDAHEILCEKIKHRLGNSAPAELTKL